MILRRVFVSQNIIKKVNGQKFVYRFVSYPDILKGDVASRAEGADGPPQAKKGESALLEGESADHSKVGCSASAKPSSRNDYIHSGLYTSFTLNSLQNGRQLFKSIKIENPAEKMADRRTAAAALSQEQLSHTQQPTLSSVIKFVNTPPKPAPAQTPATPPQVDVEPPLMPSPLDPPPAAAHRPEGLGAHSSLPSQSVYSFDQAHHSEPAFSLQDLTSTNPPPNLVLYSSQELVIDSDMESQSVDVQAQEKVRTWRQERRPCLLLKSAENSNSVQTQVLSSVLQVDGSVALSDETSVVDAETSSSSVSSSTTVSTQSSGKTRKPPKVLQISPPTLLVTTSDFSPMSLCSPSLPTASLTSAMIPVSTWRGSRAQYHDNITV